VRCRKILRIKWKKGKYERENEREGEKEGERERERVREREREGGEGERGAKAKVT
jgi:hypothetical protein